MIIIMHFYISVMAVTESCLGTADVGLPTGDSDDESDITLAPSAAGDSEAENDLYFRTIEELGKYVYF